jgi:hypothetical protein
MNAPTNVVGIREVAPAAPKPRARTKSPAPAAAARAERKAAVRANTQEVQAQRWSAGLLGGVAAVLTGLSLSHLAHGIEVITHPVYSWEPWAMGVGVDVGMILIVVKFAGALSVRTRHSSSRNIISITQ